MNFTTLSTTIPKTAPERRHGGAAHPTEAQAHTDFFQRCQFCSKPGPLKRVGVQRACERCHRAVLAYFDAIVQSQVRDDYCERGGADGELD